MISTTAHAGIASPMPIATCCTQRAPSGRRGTSFPRTTRRFETGSSRARSLKRSRPSTSGTRNRIRTSKASRSSSRASIELSELDAIVVQIHAAEAHVIADAQVVEAVHVGAVRPILQRDGELRATARVDHEGAGVPIDALHGALQRLYVGRRRARRRS